MKNLVMSQVYDVKTSFHSTIPKETFSILILFQSCYNHLVHHICNIAEFAGTKLRLKFGDVSQRGTLYFVEAFFKTKNAISYLTFKISAQLFQISTLLSMLFHI